MPISGNIGGVTPDFNQTPLISFNAICDTDIGLIRLINKEYLDKTVFDEEKCGLDNIELIKLLYYRSDFNPLSVIAKDPKDVKTLDEYYIQFMQKRIDDIIELSLYTEIYNLIKLYIDSREIFPTLLYYNEAQKQVLYNEKDFSSLNKICIDTLPQKKMDTFSQIFVKDVRELEALPSSTTDKTYYISSFRPNFFIENMELKRNKALEDIITTQYCKNNISIFDMYNEDILFRRNNIDIDDDL